jgi:hypothetical protein
MSRLYLLGVAGLGLACLLLAADARAGYYSAERLYPPPALLPGLGEEEEIVFANGIGLRNFSMRNPGTQAMLPGPGNNNMLYSFFDIFTEISTDAGTTWGGIEQAWNEADGRILAAGMLTPPAGYAEGYDTEMIQIDASIDAGAFGTLMIRESPTKASIGETDVKYGSNDYYIDSFFDVFVEISLDGGQNWYPGASYSTDGGQNWQFGDHPVHLIGTPEPGTITLLTAAGVCLLTLAWRRWKS